MSKLELNLHESVYNPDFARRTNGPDFSRSSGSSMDNSQSSKFVCASRLEDDALRQFATAIGKVHRCDYCGTTLATTSVVPVNSVTAFMRQTISKEWCAREESGSYSSEADGYLSKSTENHELFEEIGFDVASETLKEDILAAFAGQLSCRRKSDMLSPSER